MKPSHPHPSVSVVLPTLNERAYLRDCLDSLRAQNYPALIEILVVDGGSSDGTRDLVDDYGDPVRLVDNPGVTAAAALNVGLREAKGEIFVRVDAHAVYARDYVRRCVEVLLETGADNVGGRMRAVGTSRFGRAVAAVTSSPFGVGPAKFHYAEAREDVDTVYLGCWYRSTLERLGGWDESGLQWAAEDHELNFRLTEGGGRIVLDPTIESWYFPRDTTRALARQYHNYGVGKASTLVKHRSLPTLRPLAPAALVAGSVVGAVAGRGGLRVGLPLLHAGVCAVAARRIARTDRVKPADAFVALQICHWTYGAGFWRGLGRWVSGRRFASRPTGHR